MPLEIRELIIKAKVDENGTTSSSGGNTQANKNVKMNELAEKVFEILKDKKER